MSLWHLLLIAAVAVAGVAAVFDWRTGEIPNWLTFGAIVLGLLGNALLGFRAGGASEGALGAGSSLLGMLVCGATPVLLYRVGGIGGGDVKLLIAIGALLRTSIGLEAELYAFVATTLYAPARLVYEGKLLRSLGNSLSILANPFRPEEKRKTVDPELLSTVRFGPGIFLGTVVAAIVNMRLL
jgi:prepilin peptidase CpaA